MGKKQVNNMAISDGFRRRRKKELKQENDWVGDILNKMSWQDSSLR